MKIAIIGGGASGLLLANLLNKNKIDFIVFNNGKIGRKILASGNGRCNIANRNINISKYHNNILVNKLLKYKDEVFKVFDDLNIYLKEDDEGRLYPISESSLSILNIFMKNISNKIVDELVYKISKKNNKYIINDLYEDFDKVVIAIGSNANLDKYDNKLLANLNIKINEFKPSLVGFKTKNKIKEISGVRCKCNVSLFNDNKMIYNEDGEVIFKDDGISGICIMNLSSFYNHLSKYNNPYVKIDLLCGKKYNNLESVINPKLLGYINKYNIDPNNFILNIIKTYDMRFAQVASGGVDISCINDNLSLKNDNNIYLAGEIIDVDGLCGGYNLFFAFLCAIAIFEDLK